MKSAKKGTVIKNFTFNEVRIENTNHCGYSCYFCPREKLTRKKGYMDLNTFSKVLVEIDWEPEKVDLHGFGEPLLDKNICTKISLARDKWPDANIRIYSTLGISITEQKLNDILRCGLSELQISFYGTDGESYSFNHGVDNFNLAKKNIENLSSLNNSINGHTKLIVRDFPTHDTIKHGYQSDQTVASFKRWLTEIGIHEIKSRKLHNFGSGRSYNPSLKRTCSITWGYRKRVLQVTWDLTVIPCCFDFDASIRFGSLHNNTLQEIFNSKDYLKFIDAHLRNDLEKYPVCQRCEKCDIP